LKSHLIIGTRGSRLALIQTRLAAERLQQAGFEITIKTILTEGDRKQHLSLRGTAGVGLFVREIERALLAGEIDLAVHSLKDLPVDLAPGLQLAAYLRREDPREALLTARGSDPVLRPGAVIGTSSLRRVVQLQTLYPAYQYREIRGNIDTRIRKMDQGEYDALVLALAGIKRLGAEERVGRIYSLDECLPAAGQGIIAVQVRADFSLQSRLYGALNDRAAELAARAERQFLKRLGGGCRLPIGAFAESGPDGRLAMRGMVADSAGTRLLRHHMNGSDAAPEELGAALAEWFLEKGIVDWC
jgi:hydroxymethylbilane synthase